MSWLEQVGLNVIAAIISAPILFLLGWALKQLWERAQRIVKNIFVPPNALIWKIDQRQLLKNLSFTSVWFWYSGRIPVERYPIVIRFGPGTTILQWDWHIVPDKVECPVMTDEKSKQMAEKAYFISLEPKDFLTLKFATISKRDINAPMVLTRDALLIEKNKAIILLNEDHVQVSLVVLREWGIVVSKRLSSAIQVSLAVLRERGIVVSKRLSNATQASLDGLGLATIPLLILTLVLSMVIVKEGLLRIFDGRIDLGPLFFGLSLLVSISFIALRFLIWGTNTRLMFEVVSRQVSGVSTSSVRWVAFWNALASGASVMGVVLTIFVSALEYEGRHDLVIQPVEFLFTVAGKLFNSLLH